MDQELVRALVVNQFNDIEAALYEQGFVIRPRTDQGYRIERRRRTCQGCGIEFIAPRASRGGKYCTHACAVKTPRDRWQTRRGKTWKQTRDEKTSASTATHQESPQSDQ